MANGTHRKQVQLFGKVVDRHGQPLAGLGVALLETPAAGSTVTPGTAAAAQVVATSVSDSNGLFVLPAGILESVDGEKYSLQVSSSKKQVSLPELTGAIAAVIPGQLYGPVTIVADQEQAALARAVAPRAVLLAPEEEILEAIKRSPGLFFKPQAARRPDPCSPYSPPGIPTRVARYSGTVRFPTGEKTTSPEVSERHTRSHAVDVAWGFLSEVEQAWYDLGLGLGSLLYSVPLAPCEETKFAIVDWRRKDWARRQSAVDESHYQDTTVTRDQIVDETVRMTSHKEASATTSTFGYGLSLGIFTMGGGSTESKGSEDMTSDVNADRTVNDRTHMASQTVRNTRAFAIVEATQEEESVVRTRVLRNHNHGHTLTFQYFEVLQHYLVATRERRRRPVLFLPLRPRAFDFEEIAKWAYLLRRALLDPTLEPALDKVLGIATPNTAERRSLEGAAAGQASIPVTEIRVTASAGTLNANTGFDTKIRLLVNGVEYLSLTSAAYGYPYTWVFRQTLSGQGLPPLEGIRRVSVKNFSASPAVVLDDVLVEAATLPPSTGAAATVELAYWEHLEIQLGLLATRRVGGSAVSAAQDVMVEGESDFQIRRLVKHLNANRFYYTTAIIAGMDSGERMLWLAGQSAAGRSLLDLVENAVVGADGYFLALPLRNPLDLPSAYWGVKGENKQERIMAYLEMLEHPSDSVDERLITLPTPGVFAESQLGACNACEKIDDTRFWDWQRSPCPDQAPDITGEMLASRYQSPAASLEFVKPGLTPEKMVFPELPKPMITIGDETLANLTKGLQLQDPKAVMEFVGGLAAASAENYRKSIDAIVQLLPLLTGGVSGGPGSGAASAAGAAGSDAPAGEAGGAAEGSLPTSGSIGTP